MLGRLSFLFLIYFSISVQAQNLVESFDARTNEGSGSLIWNQALGRLHPPLRIFNWNDGANKSTPFSPGDGRHGSFNSEADFRRYSVGGDISSQIIRLDTDTYDDLQFTVVNLPSPWIINVVGSKPLRMRSLSTITISGTINCSGESGQSATANPLDTRQGGSGRCGGGSGGQTGAAGTSGATGYVTGGGASAAGGVNFGIGGGGGGGYSLTTGDAGENPNIGGSDDGGSLGTRFLDDGFDDIELGAGSGGGGGSPYTDPSDPANHSSGAGGGAGGGAILLYAVQDITISATGVISANGGAGGNIGGTLKAGAGGGGAGGSILMFSGGDIIVDGIVTAQGGAGGVSGQGAHGGAGSDGRTFLVGVFGDPLIGGGGSLTPPSQLVSRGDAQFLSGTFDMESQVIDLGTTVSTPSLFSTTEDLRGGTVTYTVAFGVSPSDAALNNFLPAATFLNSEQGRYFRFKVEVTNSDNQDPTKVEELSLNYDRIKANEFDFVGACGQVQAPPPSFLILSIYFLLLMLPLALRRYLANHKTTA
jgi:hypothetical protein